MRYAVEIEATSIGTWRETPDEPWRCAHGQRLTFDFIDQYVSLKSGEITVFSVTIKIGKRCLVSRTVEDVFETQRQIAGENDELFSINHAIHNKVADWKKRI